MADDERSTGFRELKALLAADFGVNRYPADRMTLLVWRLGQTAHGRGGPGAFVVRRLHSVLDALWTRAVVGAELPRSVLAGPGLRLPHSGRGVVLHPAVVIGAGATLYHRVTLGVRGGDVSPRLGDGVYIGCGAAVLGSVVLGDRCRVGANAVVLSDVEPGATAVGIPARSGPGGSSSPGVPQPDVKVHGIFPTS